MSLEISLAQQLAHRELRKYEGFRFRGGFRCAADSGGDHPSLDRVFFTAVSIAAAFLPGYGQQTTFDGVFHRIEISNHSAKLQCKHVLSSPKCFHHCCVVVSCGTAHGEARRAFLTHKRSGFLSQLLRLIRAPKTITADESSGQSAGDQERENRTNKSIVSRHLPASVCIA